MNPRPNTRTAALDAALTVLVQDGVLSLDSVARAAGLTKPGLMYHFPTKEALMSAVVDHVLDRCEASILQRLGADPSTADPARRIAAYVSWSLEEPHGAVDLVAFADPRLRAQLVERWTTRFGPYLRIDEQLDEATRTRLLALRLLADGAWFAGAADMLPPTRAERQRLQAFAAALLDEAR